jgi:hypothetical protein
MCFHGNVFLSIWKRHLIFLLISFKFGIDVSRLMSYLTLLLLEASYLSLLLLEVRASMSYI